ncbi:rod shape-determining protein [Candidatus Falkowbacteria bacterium]|nr:rod shape-determining protein [Candidatus Falkowbacteria bacterium]
MFNNLLGHFSRDLGIDLGTANTKVFVKDKGLVINEPSVVALNMKTGQILAIGEDAKKMLGKTPPHIVASRPIVGGIISDFEVTEKMLKYFIDKVHQEGFTILPRPRVVIGIPLDITEVERKAVEDAALSAGAREVFLIEKIMASAIGARLPISDAVGNIIIDVGEGTTEIAVIALSGVVNWKTLRVAGEEMNKNIIQYARDVFNLLLGEKIAEDIKIKIGSASELKEPLTMEMRGRDLLTGLPKSVTVNDTQIREALGRSVKQIIDGIKATLEVTPPELLADIFERGMILTGGGALLRGLDQAITRATEIPVRVADDPVTCAVRGTGLLLENIPLLREIAIPSTQEEEKRR